MVGARKPLRRKDPPKPSRRSPRLHSQNCRRRNTPKVEEIIDISSSYGGTDPQEVENTYPLSQISSPREDGPDEQRFKCEKEPAAEEFTEQDKLRDLVKCLATVIVNGNTLSPSQRAAGLSVLVTTCLSPTPTTNQSTVTKMSDEDGFLAKYSTQSERLTKSAPTGKLGTSGNPEYACQDTCLVKKLFTDKEAQPNYDHYINNNPIPTFQKGDIKRGLQIPYWMELSFMPPIDMDLDDLETVTAAYIFQKNNVEGYCGNEVLVKCSWGVGDRKTLKTLMPKTWVDQEILNILASKLTFCETKISTHNNHWFFPTTFAQYALDWGNKPDEMIERYGTKFMGKVDYLRKIFVPINDENLHWYLMVIDVNESKIVILDSLKCEMRNEFRKRKVKKLAMFIEEMFLDPSLYEKPNTANPIISDFVIIEPEGLPQQLNGYDCGVWVAN